MAEEPERADQPSDGQPPDPPVTGSIVEVGPVPDGLAAWLTDELAAYWPTVRWIRDLPLAVPPDWEDRPVDVDRVLDAVIERTRPDADLAPEQHLTLALCGLEAVTPGHGQVFGRATVGGGFALVAVRPLQHGAGTAGEGLALLRTRILKESLHGVGHAAGRGHCANPRCLMHPVTDLAGVDGRSFRFCARCEPFPSTAGGV